MIVGATGGVVIVGAGHAGTALAGLLRQGGHGGKITVLSAESDPPYHRPPLSKKCVGPELEQWLRPPEFWAEQQIELRLGTPVASLDRECRRVLLSCGEAVDYEHLVLATGARARPLTVPGADLDGILQLRTLSDAWRLRPTMSRGRKLVIIGGGYIGLEIAAVARSEGADVTIVERESRLLSRVASAALSEILARHHRRSGTRIVTGADVVGIAGRSGHVSGVQLADGRQIDCDTVLVGIGAMAADELAVAAGLDCENGIRVNSQARTNDQHVLAIGDVTRRPVPGLDGLHRLESIPSGTEQAKQAAAVILGAMPPRPEMPWFWSDQLDLKLKIAGMVLPGQETVLRGDPDTGRFALYHLVDDVVAAAETANAASDFMAAKTLIAQQTQIDPGRLADVSVNVRDAFRPREEAACPS